MATPFRAAAQVKASLNQTGSPLNATTDNIRLSKRSIAGSINARTINNDASFYNSMIDHRRALSIANSANNTLEKKKKKIDAVKKGYLSSTLFEHTIADVMRVLEHKLNKRK